jgi:hypothetical protein
MKKIFILLLSLSLLFVVGCGSGGGGGTASIPTSPGDSSGAVNSGSFTLTLQDGDVRAANGVRHIMAIDPAAADTVRAVIRKVELVPHVIPTCVGGGFDDEGNCVGGTPGTTTVFSNEETYRRVVDAPISGGTVTITAPVSADGSDTYTIDVLTYTAGPPNEMLKFGRAVGVLITNGGNQTITINDICADPGIAVTDANKLGSVFIQIPTKIISEQTYNVAADVRTYEGDSTPTPVRKSSQWGVSLSSSGTTLTNTFDLTNPVKTAGTAKLTAPFTTNQLDTSLLFSVKFFINDNMLDTAKREKFTDWTRVYPGDPGTTGETLESTFVPLANVTVPVN